MPVFYNLFQNIEAEGIPPNWFNETSITLTSKLDKDVTRKGNFRPLSLMNKMCKNPQQNIGKLNNV